MMNKEYLPGILFSLIIAFFSFYLSTVHASFDALVISIIGGMFIGNLIADGEMFHKGIEAAIKIFMPVGIALYGTQLFIAELHLGMFLSIFAVFSGLFLLVLIISRLFGLDRNLAVLLAAGLSVCGASAIAVISPLIGAKKEDTSISILSVMMLGLAGMLFYPLIFDMFALTLDEFNFFAGTTLPMLGQVKVAATAVSPACLSSAVQIKLIRISFLVFVITLSIFLSGKKEKKVKAPWFILVFIFLVVFCNTTDFLKPLIGSLGKISSFFLSAGLAAIGFSVDFDAIVKKGLAPLAVICSSWLITLFSIFLIRHILHV
ncbi:MAG: putative sulfate exporter family transporter [Nitrospirota bacterium]|nr:putative sulfate exporter family transporter [Nitrospirota bacterium]